MLYESPVSWRGMTATAADFPALHFKPRFTSGSASVCTRKLVEAQHALAEQSSIFWRSGPQCNHRDQESSQPLDQQLQASLSCGTCSRPSLRLSRVALRRSTVQRSFKYRRQEQRIDDHHPRRIQARSLFDLAVGDDNLLHGTRYATARAAAAQIGFHFSQKLAPPVERAILHRDHSKLSVRWHSRIERLARDAQARPQPRRHQRRDRTPHCP